MDHFKPTDLILFIDQVIKDEKILDLKAGCNILVIGDAEGKTTGYLARKYPNCLFFGLLAPLQAGLTLHQVQARFKDNNITNARVDTKLRKNHVAKLFDVVIVAKPLNDFDREITKRAAIYGTTILTPKWIILNHLYTIYEPYNSLIKTIFNSVGYNIIKNEYFTTIPFEDARINHGLLIVKKD